MNGVHGSFLKEYSLLLYHSVNYYSFLQESIKAKDSQLAVLRVRLQEGDHDIKAKDTLITELQDENKR